MKTPRLLLVLSLLALAAAPARSQEAKEGGDGNLTRKEQKRIAEDLDGRPSPPSLHLGSFGSMRAARLTADGTLDTGAGLVQLIDAESGKPLLPGPLAYGAGPEFYADWSHAFDGVSLEVRMLATGSVRNGDERTKSLIHLQFINRTDSPHTVRFGARLMAGGGDPALRPMPSIPFKAGSVFAREGNLVTRDGSVFLTWLGLDPLDVNILPPPATPEADAALLTWSIDLPPQTARYLDLFVAGPSASGEVDEGAWRTAIARWSYSQVEEQLLWQSRFRGIFADMELASPSLRRAVVGSVHLLRMLGDADRAFHVFSDRAYGHPASDDAVQAEVVGLMFEYAFAIESLPLLKTLVNEADARAAALPPARRVAYMHGLARAVRLGTDTALAQQLAGSIRALVTEPVEVEPWLDPAEVALDLQGILDWAGPAPDGSGADYALPALAWCSAPVGPVETIILEMRRALSAGDDAAAWADLKLLLAGTTVNGFGTTRADGELDGRFAMALLALSRSMLVNDHGDDLVAFPHLPGELLPYPGMLNLVTLPTRYGVASFETHFIGIARKTVGVHLRLVMSRPFGRLLVNAPYGCTPREIKGTLGGNAELQPDGSIDCRLDPLNPSAGIRFNIKLAPE